MLRDIIGINICHTADATGRRRLYYYYALILIYYVKRAPMRYRRASTKLHLPRLRVTARSRTYASPATIFHFWRNATLATIATIPTHK